MGFVKEPNGVTLVVEKVKLTTEIEEAIKNFIKKSKKKNKKLIDSLKEKVELD
ncbi:MAG: hypothetical protein KAG14_05065 [Mycoplasmataceae bacterium]|nr:hypothetical protein [Mycoplasmataceae bacterium]